MYPIEPQDRPSPEIYAPGIHTDHTGAIKLELYGSQTKGRPRQEIDQVISG